jgi:hypothetical protein
MIALRRIKKREVLLMVLIPLIGRFQQIIETVNNQLIDRFGIDQNGAHSI